MNVSAREPQYHMPLSASRIRAQLCALGDSVAIEVYDEIDSTNNEAKRRAAAGDRTPSLILA